VFPLPSTYPLYTVAGPVCTLLYGLMYAHAVCMSILAV
jgi:hypothetical protein